jgi:hypothetical protein
MILQCLRLPYQKIYYCVHKKIKEHMIIQKNHIEASLQERVFATPELTDRIMDYLPGNDLKNFIQINRSTYHLFHTLSDREKYPKKHQKTTLKLLDFLFTKTTNTIIDKLIFLAKNDKIWELHCLVGSEKFNEIALDIFIKIFIKVAENGLFEIVEALIQCPKFAALPAEDLGEGLCCSAANGHIRVVEALIQCSRFTDILSKDLGRGLRWSAATGRVRVVEALIQCSRFSNIHFEDLGKGLRWSAENGYVGVVEALIQCSRFTDILSRDLGKGLLWSAENGHVEVVEALTQCSRSTDILSAFITLLSEDLEG